MRNYCYYTSLARILQMRRSGSILRLSGGEKQRIAFVAAHPGRAACVNPVESLKFPPCFLAYKSIVCAVLMCYHTNKSNSV